MTDAPQGDESATVPALAGKDARLRVHAEDPPNVGTPMELLGAARLTRPEWFFVRCHGPIPRISGADHRISVGGLVERPLELTIADLRSRFAPERLEATLICAGNRRAGLSAIEPTRGTLQWLGDAIGNAFWTGASLAAVLAEAGVLPGARHVAFEGADLTPDRGPDVRFGSSIPLEKALRGRVLLAYEMAGAPLPPQHGYPVRAVVPGYVGARSVKWLRRITVQQDPSDNPFQARDYQLFPRHVRPETASWEKGIPLGDTPIDSAITEPLDGARLPAGVVVVRGYALAGGDRTVERVEVTGSGGVAWHVARFIDDAPLPGASPPHDARWRWRRWEVHIELPAGEHELAVRAWDSAANTQPDDPAAIWNFAGYANNSWHRIRIRVDASGPAA